jgi:DNA-binding transcriptional LysR family regulator
MSIGDARRLRTFALIADLGSVSAAASVLGYTQSAVSQQLLALEREVGEVLIDRSQRPLRTTPAGATLRPHVDAVLAAIGDAEAVLEDIRAKTPRVRLAAFTSALASFVPAAVRDLRRTRAEVVVEVLQVETDEAAERLRSGAADLAVVHYMPGVAVPETGGLQRRPLLVDHLYVVVPEGHRLARRAEVAVADLDGEPLVLPRRDTPAGRFRSVVEHLCARAGFAPLVAYELNDLPAVQAFVAAGIAVVPMHGLTLTTVPPGATVRPLADRPAGSRTVEALVPTRARTPIVDELAQRLTAAAAAYTLTRRAGGSSKRR